jgi:hypothetical protein
MEPSNQIWIGLAEVAALEGCRRLGDSKGASVNVVAWANSEPDFRSRVRKVVAELDLKLLDLEDCEPFSKRQAQWEVDDVILQMVDTANEEHNRNNVVFGTFHLWKKADA